MPGQLDTVTPCLPTSPHLMRSCGPQAECSTVQVSSGTRRFLVLGWAGLGTLGRWLRCHTALPNCVTTSHQHTTQYREGLARTPRLQAPGSRTCAMLPRSPCGSWRGPSSAAARTRRPNINGLPKCALIRQQAAWLTQRVCTCSMLSRCCRPGVGWLSVGLSSGGAAQETDRDRQY